MTGRCLFGFSGEKPFLLPDNEGIKMNTSPVRMDDLPLNRFHCRIAALTFGAHLTDGYVLGVIGYAIIQLTPAMQLTPFMAGMIGGSGAPWFVPWQPGSWVDLRPYWSGKKSSPSAFC